MSETHSMPTQPGQPAIDLGRRELLRLAGIGTPAAAAILNTFIVKAQNMSNRANNFYASDR